MEVPINKSPIPILCLIYYTYNRGYQVADSGPDPDRVFCGRRKKKKKKQVILIIFQRSKFIFIILIF